MNRLLAQTAAPGMAVCLAAARRLAGATAACRAGSLGRGVRLAGMAASRGISTGQATHSKKVYLQEQLRQQSLDDPEGFWMSAQREIDWITPPTRALLTPDPTQPHKVLWFPGATLNVSYNALDRHVHAGRKDQVALIYDSPVTHTVVKYTYGELLQRVMQAATMLRRQGVGKGDRVVSYMGMVPEAIVAMLACARLGAIHSVVFGGFAAHELAKRIEDCRPKVVLASSCGVEGMDKVVAYKPLLDAALDTCAHKPDKVVVLQRRQMPGELRAGEQSWQHAVDGIPAADVYRGYAAVEANEPLYILYTSGTTGKPKGVVRPSGGHAVVLQYTMQRMYGCAPGQVYWAASDLGWILGHSYICYGPLLNGSTTVLYEGKPVGTPDAGAFYRVMEQHRVTTFFTAPTALMILRREDPHGAFRSKHDLSGVRAMFLAGERCAPEIQRWWVRHVTGTDDTGHAEHRVGTPVRTVVSDNWWQTETGSPLAGIMVGLSEDGAETAPVKYGSAGLPVQGVDLRVLRVADALDEDAEADARPTEEAAAGEVGNVVVRLPLPPGVMSTLWGADERFHRTYFRRFPGYYDTGDMGMVDADGYVHILSRADDIINVAAHRLSTSAIEEVVVEHNEVAEACVVARAHAIKGSVPVVLAVCKHHRREHTLQAVREDVVAAVRLRVGAFASVYAANVVFVERLPKTRSGKVLRKMVRAMIAALDTQVHGRGVSAACPVPTPATIEDEAAKDEVWGVLRRWAAEEKQG
ncbi:hypothetical protein GGI15_003900 [Coemansia interrupta]|uniref:Uncharacterized protein n=1 Tax=Coemansia interrupta TaxID=1126814 RepID=A0A9W8HDF1_9FUNG|nr:hypothetical protein GGI15_003900 [Coemansia interrupta]